MAGVDSFTFQKALGEHGTPLYTEQRLADDLETLKTRLDNRERAIKSQEAELERRRQEVRRMREKIQELL